MSMRELSRTTARAKPQEIPPAGWWDITWRVVKRLGTDNITLVSGGVAMYALLSVFPALAVIVSVYGLFASPSDVVKQMSAFSVMPPILSALALARGAAPIDQRGNLPLMGAAGISRHASKATLPINEGRPDGNETSLGLPRHRRPLHTPRLRVQSPCGNTRNARRFRCWWSCGRSVRDFQSNNRKWRVAVLSRSSCLHPRL